MGATTRAGDPSQAPLCNPLPLLPVSGPGGAVELGVYFCAVRGEAIMLVQNVYQVNNQPNTAYFRPRGDQPSPQWFCSHEVGSLGCKLYIRWRFPQPSQVGGWIKLAWLSSPPRDFGHQQGTGSQGSHDSLRPAEQGGGGSGPSACRGRKPAARWLVKTRAGAPGELELAASVKGGV